MIVLAGLGGYLVLNSRLFHDYVIRTTLRAINNATGTKAEIGELDLQPAQLIVNIYDVTLHGGEETSHPPLLHIEKLRVHIGIGSLLHRQIVLDDVSIDRPTVYTLCDNKGVSNFPRGAGHGAGSSGNKLALSVSHLLLTRGELTYRDARIPLDADVQDLSIEVNQEPQSGRSRTSISYRDGLFRLPAYSPMHHSLAAQLLTSPSHISIEAARLSIGSSVISIHGEIDDLGHPQVLADYDVRLHTKDLGNRFGLAPTSVVTLSGRVHYANSPLQPTLLRLSGTGELSSDILELSNSVGNVKLEAIHAQYELADGAFRVPGIQLRLLGGHASASLDIEHLEDIPAYKLGISLDGISLQEMQQAVRNKGLARIPLSGTLNGTVDSRWTGSMTNIISRCNLHFDAPTAHSASHAQSVLPVVGTADFTYHRPRNLLTIQPATLRIGSLNLALQGDVGDRSHLNIHASADNSQQFASLIASFRTNDTPDIVAGSAELKAQMQGAVQSPHFVGYLSGKDVVIKHSRWSLVSTAFELSPSMLSLQRASMVNAYEGMVRMSGNVELERWSYVPLKQAQFSVSLHALPISELQNIAGRHYADKGEVSGDVSLHGLASDLTGSGTINIHNAEVFEEPLQTVTAHFSADHGSITSAVDIRSQAGSATANLSYAYPTSTYDFRLNTSGIALQELRVIRRRNLPLRGVVTISATGEGSVANPKLTAIVEVNEAQFHGNPVSQIRGKADLVGHSVDVECRSQIAGGSVQMHGHANLGGEYYTEATIDSDILHLERLQDIYPAGSDERLQGQTEFHMILKGPLRRASQLEAHVSIPTLTLSYESLQVRAVNPIQLGYSRSLLTLEPAEFQGSGTAFHVQGSVPLESSSLLNIRATGSIDAGMLRMLAPDVKSSGSLSFDVHTVGSRNNPSLEGQILLKDVALATPTAPLGVGSLSGTLSLGNGKLRIVNLSGKSADGELSMAGTIVYQPHLQFDVTLQAKAVRLRYAGLKMLIDSDLALVGQANGPTIRGTASVTELSLASDLDLKTLSEGFGHHNAPQQGRVSDSIKLAVLVQSKDRLKASNSQLSVEGNLNLQVIGTAADPVIVGRMDLTSAEFLYRARRYQLQRGFVVFDNTHQTRPTLDVSVTTTVQQYNLTLSARGPLEKLTTSYVSDPPLPTADIISLVAFGNTTQTTDAAGHGADSILASQVGGQLSNKMQGLTGIAGLRIDPLVGGNNRNPSARIALQQRVTKNFLFTFSTDVSQPGSETVEGTYQINKRWSVGVARDPTGGISAEGRYHTRF